MESAARRFHGEARLEHVTGHVQHGPEGYSAFATRWLEAFPDGMFSVEGIRPRERLMYDVDLVATGTHTGTLALGSWVFGATNLEVRLPARELFHIRDGRFDFASLSFEMHDLVGQLTNVDIAKLLQHISRIGELGRALSAAEGQPQRQKELLDRLGRQLDEARHVARPYFK
jgi:SnoaL-like polyketide cyclase